MMPRQIAHERGSRTSSAWKQNRGKITTELLEFGISVCAPIFGNERYDLIVDRNGELERVQVKTAYSHHERADTVVVGFESTVYQSYGTPKKTYYTASEIDSYIVYCPKRDRSLYVPFDETPRTQMSFSFRDKIEYNAHNRKAIHFAEDYELSTRLGELPSGQRRGS